MHFTKMLLIPKVGGADIDRSHYIINRIKATNEAMYGRLTIIDSIADADETTLVVPVGGDGTFVHAAKLAVDKGACMLGINIGKVGFLTDALGDNPLSFLGDIKKGCDEVDERILLRVEYGGKTYLALNDFVVSDLYSDSIINYDLQIGKNAAGNHTANSVIIATPTGSTAYPMSNGGPIIDPTLDVFEIIAVAPLSLSTRPIIVSGDRQAVTVTVNIKEGRTTSFKADGQECARIIGGFSGDTATINITKYGKKVRLFHPDKNWNFFEKISVKMGWNQ